MKIKKIKRNKIKTLNLNILKIRKNNNNLNFNILIKDTEFRLKKALNIIYRYHISNKKILFLGTSPKLHKSLKELLKNTKHSFIPEKIWVNGILTNTKSIFRFLFKKYFNKNKNNLKFLFNLTSNSNLIVVLNDFLSNKPLEEFAKKRIPTIAINYNIKNLNYYLSTYKIKQRNLVNNKETLDNFFYLIIRTTIKKAERVRNKLNQYRLKQKSKFNRTNFNKLKKKNVFRKKK